MATEPSINAGHRALEEALAGSLRLLRGVMILVLAAYALSGVFIVRQHERAIILRFGKIAGLGPDRLRGPGLHWTLPRPFSEVLRVPTERVQTLDTEAFWYHRDAAAQLRGENPEPGPALRPGLDGYSLTADANLAHTRWSLRYVVRDAERYLLAFRDPRATLQNELERAVVVTSARFPVDAALRTDLETFREGVEGALRRRLEIRGPGVRVERLDLVEAAPPRQVAPAFDAVIMAEQERSRSISAARAAAARKLNEAQGETVRIRSEAESDRQRLLSEITAEAEAFTRVRAEFVKAPSLVARALWQDAVRRALAGAEDRFIIRRKTTGEQEFRLLLNREGRISAEGGR